MENPIKMDDLGGKPTIFGNIHIGSHQVTVSCKDLVFSITGKYADAASVADVDLFDTWAWLKADVLAKRLMGDTPKTYTTSIQCDIFHQNYTMT